MSRADFMRSLAELLADVSPAERDEAIQYYNDYFDDAGAENEQSVIDSLGTPEQLARTIKAGLSDSGNTGEFTEKGFSGYEQKSNNEVLDLEHSKDGNSGENSGQSGDNGQFGGQNNGGASSQFNAQNAYGYRQEGGYGGNYQSYYNDQNGQNSKNGKVDKQGGKKMSGGMIILIVFLCILAFPVALGIGTGFLGGIVGLFAGLLGILIGIGAAAVALLIAGVSLFVYGITLLFGAPLAGLCVMGAAMVCMAIGLLCLWIVVMICGLLIPAIVRGVVRLFQKMFHRGGAAA